MVSLIDDHVDLARLEGSALQPLMCLVGVVNK